MLTSLTSLIISQSTQIQKYKIIVKEYNVIYQLYIDFLQKETRMLIIVLLLLHNIEKVTLSQKLIFHVNL